jgi:hypothetical protein
MLPSGSNSNGWMDGWMDRDRQTETHAAGMGETRTEKAKNRLSVYLEE